MATTYYTDVTKIVDEKLRGLSVSATGDGITAGQLENACKQAHDIINSRLSRLYAVPFSTASPPAQIREISDMLVVNLVWRYGAGRSVRPKGATQDEYDRAIDWLARIADGKDIIVGTTPKSAAGGLKSSTEGEHPVFFPGDELDMGQDPDQADRLSDERE